MMTGKITLNRLVRSLSSKHDLAASRVVVLHVLVCLEDAGLITSEMERTIDGEEDVQKWTRVYRRAPGASNFGVPIKKGK